MRRYKCAGCGACQNACLKNNVHKLSRLGKSAIVVRAGEGMEDRLASGSYIDLGQAQRKQREQVVQDVKYTL